MHPIVFAHGLESSPQGIKAALLSTRFGTHAPDLRSLSLEAQTQRLVAGLRQAPKSVLVGSSLGGLAALGAARAVPERIAHLILLAPAFGTERHLELFASAEIERPGLRSEVAACADWTIPESVPATVLHGLEDELIATADVVAFAQRSPSAALLLVHDSHQLGAHLELLCRLVAAAANGEDLFVSAGRGSR